MTSGKRPRETLAAVDANVENPLKQERKEPKSRRNSLQNHLETKFEEQNTTIIKEMCHDIKHVVRTLQTMEKTISNLQGKVEERSKHQTRMMEALNKNLRECGQRSNATSATVAEQVSPILLPSSHSHLPSAEPSASQPPLMQDICPYQRCSRCQDFFNLWILQ